MSSPYSKERQQFPHSQSIRKNHHNHRDPKHPLSMSSSFSTSRLKVQRSKSAQSLVRKNPPSQEMLGSSSLHNPNSSLHGPSDHSKSKKHVRFGFVDIRSYKRCLGDNPPSVTGGGPSLSLDWEYKSLGKMDIDSYERQLKHEWKAKQKQMMQRYYSTAHYHHHHHHHHHHHPLGHRHPPRHRGRVGAGSILHSRPIVGSWKSRPPCKPLSIDERKDILVRHANCTKKDMDENSRENLRLIRSRRRNVGTTTTTTATGGTTSPETLLLQLANAVRHSCGVGKTSTTTKITTTTTTTANKRVPYCSSSSRRSRGEQSQEQHQRRQQLQRRRHSP